MSEKMYECKSCKQQIIRRAETSPHCCIKNRRARRPIVGMISLLALMITFSLAACESGPIKVGENPGTSATNSQLDKNNFAVGEIAELKDVQVALIDVFESTGSSFNTPEEGNIFVLCEFEITNNSKKDVAVSSMLSFDAYCDDYACSYSLSALLEKGNKGQLDGTVAVGKKLKGVIGYEVPTDWKELEIHFTPDFWSGKDIIFIATNN